MSPYSTGGYLTLLRQREIIIDSFNLQLKCKNTKYGIAIPNSIMIASKSTKRMEIGVGNKL